MDKIQTAVDYFKEHGDERFFDEVDNFQKDANIKINVSSLKHNPEMEKLLKILQEKINVINKNLAENEEIIGTDKAKFLYHEKMCYQYLINFFDGADEFVNNLDKRIDELIN